MERALKANAKAQKQSSIRNSSQNSIRRVATKKSSTEVVIQNDVDDKSTIDNQDGPGR